MPEDLSFAELMQQVRAGNQDAVTQVFNSYIHRLVGLARKKLSDQTRQKTGSEVVAQSAMQSFLAKHTEEVDLQSEESLWAVLLEITLRHCNKWNKRMVRAPKVAAIQPGSEGSGSGLEPVGDEPSPEESVALAELVDHMKTGLNERQRHVFDMRLDGYTLAEISEHIQLSLAMVHRIMEQVRAHVSKHMDARPA